ncbi:hypothetical protein HPB49_003890 [Dermacentor silvarum]|uniref:Uncharacterized protein n=1 Tax=Dermacentor silvarum TaxID=543639 RepID=A0ACB8C1J6_DERSI|nr:hypothetical protein HPB49_003890 [Dermacentor silvarum]
MVKDYLGPRHSVCRDDTYNVDVGETLASTFSEYRQVDAYVEDLVRDLNGTHDSESINGLVMAILKLDSELEKIRRDAGKNPRFVYGSLDQMRALTADGVNWKRAVKRGLPEWLRNETTAGSRRLQVREAGIIVRLVDRLRPEPLELVGLHALVVLLSQNTSHRCRNESSLASQIMKYKVSMQQSVGAFSSSDRMLWCLEQTATYFSAVYADWVAAKFQDKADAETLKAMFDHVVTTLSRDNRVNAGVVIRTHRLKRARLVLLGGDGAMPNVKVPVHVDDRFLPNVARMIASRVGRVDDAALQTSLLQLKGHFGFQGGDFAVATAFVHRTTLYSPFAREDTRYATLAVRILRALFESESDYDPAWSAHYVNHCFAASVASTVGRSPVAAEQDGGSGVKPFMGSRWAVQLAWRMHRSSSSPLRESGAAQNSSGSSSSKFARLFFRLACFARCGKGTVVHNGRIQVIGRFSHEASLKHLDPEPAKRSLVLRYSIWYAKCCRILGCLYISNLNDETLKTNRATWKSPYTLYSAALLTMVAICEGSNIVHKSSCQGDLKCKFTDSIGVVVYALAGVQVLMNIVCLVRGSARILQLLRDAVAFERSSAFKPDTRSAIQDRSWFKITLRLSVLLGLVASFSLLGAVQHKNFQFESPTLAPRPQGPGRLQLGDVHTLRVNHVTAFEECQATWASRMALRDAAAKIEAVRVNVCKIRALKNAVNDVWGPAIVTSSACLVGMLCTTLYRSFYIRVVHEDAWLRFTYTVYSALCFVDMVLVSSDLGSEVENLKEATKPMSLLDATDAYSLQVSYLHDIIEPDSMCLSAGRFFRIDRTLLVTMAGSIITFTVGRTTGVGFAESKRAEFLRSSRRGGEGCNPPWPWTA